MTNIRALLKRIEAEEQAFSETAFLAPCTRGGRIRARVAGMIQLFTPAPSNFEGWGIFQAGEKGAAVLLNEASLPQVEEYLRLLQPLRFRLVRPLQGSTWLTYPANEGSARQPLGTIRPVPLHLVQDGAPFEMVIARGDRGTWWFEDVDRRADPADADRLRGALREATPPDQLRFPGLTPEMRVTYDLAAQAEVDRFEHIRHRRTEDRLQDALRLAGGALQGFQERNDVWLVEWTGRDGEHHASAISRDDLTVVSSGICLSGRDQDFDLQSLVGVMEGRADDDW